MELNNQQKIEAIITQAQRNGWMEGWRFIFVDIFNGARIIYNVEMETPKGFYDKFSLSDIIFNKNFAEKFFPDKDECYHPFCSKHTPTRSHQIVMLSMSDQERIDFLYKHVVKESSGNTAIDEAEIELQSFVNKMMKEEPKKIEELKPYFVDKSIGEEVRITATKYTIDKINELVDAVNRLNGK